MPVEGGVGKGLAGKREDSAPAHAGLIITRRGKIYMKNERIA